MIWFSCPPAPSREASARAGFHRGPQPGRAPYGQGHGMSHGTTHGIAPTALLSSANARLGGSVPAGGLAGLPATAARWRERASLARLSSCRGTRGSRRRPRARLPLVSGAGRCQPGAASGSVLTGKQYVSPADAGLVFNWGVLRPVCLCRWPDIGAQCCVRSDKQRHLPRSHGAIGAGAGQHLAVRAERHRGRGVPAPSREGDPDRLPGGRVPQPHGPVAVGGSQQLAGPG